MAEYTFYLTEDGKLPDGMHAPLRNEMKRLAGKKVRLSLVEARDKRSLSQNDYWFTIINTVILPEIRKLGHQYADKEFHNSLMMALGYWTTETDLNGKDYPQRRESKKFTTQEWEIFMEEARAFCALNYEVMIPLPNETF